MRVNQLIVRLKSGNDLKIGYLNRDMYPFLFIFTTYLLYYIIYRYCYYSFIFKDMLYFQWGKKHERVLPKRITILFGMISLFLKFKMIVCFNNDQNNDECIHLLIIILDVLKVEV